MTLTGNWTTNAHTFNKLRPLSIGFDSLFDDFDRLLDTPAPSYPPYNLIRSKDAEKHKNEEWSVTNAKIVFQYTQ